MKRGTFCFTATLAHRRQRLSTLGIEALREAVREVRRAHPFEIIAWVVLPEHMHAVWALPAGDSAYSLRWNRIKRAFSKRISKEVYISSPRRAG